MKRATYEDVLNAPEHKVAEILDGELVLSPRPAPRHALAASRLGGILQPFDDDRRSPGGWWILLEPELHFGDQVLVPDLAGWRRERLPTIPDEAHFTLAPDWVCEVLSASTASLDRALKMPVYAREGVQYVWLVDPERQSLEVFRLQDGRYTLLVTHAGMTRVRAEPFEALELELPYLWGKK